MKTLVQILLIVALCGCAVAQSTTVTATITDSDGQTWNNGTYSVSFVPNRAYPNGSYVWQGQQILPGQYTSGTLNGSGVLSVSLPTTSAISGVGSTWNFSICPNASASCFNYNTAITGTTEDFSAQMSAASTAPRFSPGPYAYGYLDVELVTPRNPGAAYYNVTSTCLKLWSGSAWACTGSGGTSVSVNGVSVSNPNFNGTTPAAPGGDQNLTYQSSGSSVSGYVPLPTCGALSGNNTTGTAGNTTFCRGDGAWVTVTSGTVTSITAVSPLSGGTITSSGSIGCPTCIVASSPGAGVAHFAGSTQTVTSSPVSLTADVSDILPVLNGGSGTSTPSLVAGANVTITGTWPNQTVASSAGGVAQLNMQNNGSAYGSVNTGQTGTLNFTNCVVSGTAPSFNIFCPNSGTINAAPQNVATAYTGAGTTNTLGGTNAYYDSTLSSYTAPGNITAGNPASSTATLNNNGTFVGQTAPGTLSPTQHIGSIVSTAQCGAGQSGYFIGADLQLHGCYNSVNLGLLHTIWLTSCTGTNAYTCSAGWITPYNPASYPAGAVYCWVPPNSNASTTVSMTIDAGSTYSVYQHNGIAPVANEFLANHPDCLLNTGAQFEDISSGSGSASSIALNSITAANASMSSPITNGNFSIQWGWQLTSINAVGMYIGESSASTGGGGPTIWKVQTLAGSTATPLRIFDSLTGSQTLPAFRISPTWNTSGVVDAAILVDVTNTNSGAGSKIMDLKSGATSEFSADIAGNVTNNGHLNQSATNNYAGTCSMSTSTSCTFSLNVAYTGTPICITNVQGSTVVAGACSVSGTTVTITAASSNSQTWGAVLIGNPN